MIAKVSREWQITLPEDIIRQLDVCEGSLLECRVEEGEIRLRPVSSSKRGENGTVRSLLKVS